MDGFIAQAEKGKGSCTSNIKGPVSLQNANHYAADYAWTDLTYLLHKANVPWAYYVAPGTEPDCEDDAASCTATKQGPNKQNVLRMEGHSQSITLIMGRTPERRR
jgi:hypothetical protein